MDDTSYQGLWALGIAAVAILIELCIGPAGLCCGPAGSKSRACTRDVILQLGVMAVDLFAVVYMVFFLSLVPCGNTPRLN